MRDRWLEAADALVGLAGVDAGWLRGPVLTPLWTWALLGLLLAAALSLAATRDRRRWAWALALALCLCAIGTILVPAVGPGAWSAHRFDADLQGRVLSASERVDILDEAKRSRTMGAWPESDPRRGPASPEAAIALVLVLAVASRRLRIAALAVPAVLAPWVLRQEWAVALVSGMAVGGLGWWIAGRIPRRRPRIAIRRPAAAGSTRLAAIFAISGASALLYELAAARSLTAVFGGTADAIATVLATYMVGLSLGAWIGGRIADRVRSPVRIYALAEVAIAVTVLALPLGREWILDAYVAAVRSGASASGATVLRVALSGALLLPPTLAMGATLPLLVADWMRRDPDATRAVPRLYGANTVGAAIGVLAGTWIVLPGLGITKTLWLVAGLDLLAAVLALRAIAGLRASAIRPADPEGAAAGSDLLERPALLVAAVLCGSAALFALEVLWTHVLAVVVGNSAYAFGIMLFCVLVGLATGGSSAERIPVERRARSLSLDAAAFAALVGASLLLWDRVPSLFHILGYSVDGFAGRETVRFLVCLGFLFPPCFLSGRIYALAVALYTAHGAGAGRRVGRVSAASTVGAVIGSLGGSFAILPAAGSEIGMRLMAGALLGSAVLYAHATRTTPRFRARLLAGSLVGVALLALLPRWNVDRLTDGSNVYFQRQWFGTTAFVHEDKFGGLTTVRRDGGDDITLLTNGKFQGSNTSETHAQRDIALFPILHIERFRKALVVGLGTGMTAATVRRFPFEEVVVAEISPGIVEAARRWFAPINDGVVDTLGRDLKRQDGRHWLLITEDRYDLISLEISSIWFAGAAALYNRELYALARDRLTDRGVFQQWVQLHHIYPRDLATVFASIRAVFEHVELFVAGTQGVLIAANRPLSADPRRLRDWCTNPAFERACELAGGDLRRVPLDAARLLDGEGLDRFVARVAEQASVEVASLVSTDDALALEYATPRGNVLPADSGERMQRFLRSSSEKTLH